MTRRQSNLDVSEEARRRNVHQTSMKRPRVKPSQSLKTPLFIDLDVWTFETVATNVHPSKQTRQHITPVWVKNGDLKPPNVHFCPERLQTPKNVDV